MRTLAFVLAVSSAVPAVAQDDASPSRASKPAAALSRAPKLDGNLKEHARASPLNASGADAKFTARVTQLKDTVFFAIDVEDDAVQPTEFVSGSLYFPDAGATARGYLFRFGPEGTRNAPALEAPEYAQAHVQAVAKVTPKGFRVEARIPSRAFPRFPATGPLIAEVCFSYEDRDGEEGEQPETVTNCKDGAMKGPAVKFSDDFRKALKLKPPETVRALERREDGWLGFAVLHHPRWVIADAKELTSGLLRRLLSDTPIVPESARLSIPAMLQLPDGRAVMSTVTGENPYSEGACDADKELRLGLYVVKGNVGERALDWPAATCGYGRATSVEMDEDGALTIGYSNGATVHFIWSKDHFERTEIGSR